MVSFQINYQLYATFSKYSLLSLFRICGVLRDLVPFVEFKKREKHSWRSVNFSKVAGFSQHSSMGVFHAFEIVQIIPNRATHNIWSSFNIT